MITHPELVAKLVKPGIKIKEEITSREIQTLFYLLTICVESAKLLDTYKKVVIYRKPLDETKICSEISELSNHLELFENNIHERTEVEPDAKTLKENITPIQAHMLHMALGVFGEGGELLDTILNHIFYKEPIDLENIIEELGDGEFYNEGIRQIFNLVREGILNKNIEKLSKRYESLNYSDKQAQERKDKEIEEKKSWHYDREDQHGGQ
jgi:NTP pyrophosphatase (non-canonical NTP hydrolase)